MFYSKSDRSCSPTHSTLFNLSFSGNLSSIADSIYSIAGRHKVAKGLNVTFDSLRQLGQYLTLGLDPLATTISVHCINVYIYLTSLNQYWKIRVVPNNKNATKPILNTVKLI